MSVVRIPENWWHDFPPEYGFRGEKYEQTGRVVSVRWHPAEERLDALVRGRDDRMYDVRIRVPQHAEGKAAMVEGRCTCPVSFNCKHVAAVLIAIQRGHVTVETDGDGEP